MINILNIGTRIIAISLTAAQLLVSFLLFPNTSVNNPMTPVPGWRLKNLDSRRPSFRDINSHCIFSSVAPIVAVRKRPVSEDKTLSTKIVLLLELYRKWRCEVAVASEA
jgi:hypothetical protein